MSRATAVMLPLLLLTFNGCDDSARRPDPVPGTRPGLHYAIFLNGSKANDDKRQRCADEILLSSGVVDPAAPVQAVLTLEEGSNKLQIISRARGILRNEDLPG